MINSEINSKINLQEKYDLCELGFISNKNLNIKLPKEYNYLKFLLNNLILIDVYNIEYILPKLDDYEYYLIKEIYTLCSIISHKYIVYKKNSNKKIILPYIVAKPWYESSSILGINCVLTHSSVDLWNWNFKDKNKNFSLDNIKSKYLMSDYINEKKTENWFYMIMTAIEGECGKMIYNMFKIYNVIENDELNLDIIYENLLKINEKMNKQIKILLRIYEECDPEIFYYNLREYLYGSDKLEDGLILENISSIPLKYRGGSASQSALIHSQDIFFNIKHNDKYLLEMRDYMSKKHRDLLNDLDKKKNLLDFINDKKKYIENNNLDKLKIDLIKEEYNDCIKKLLKFRKIHFNIVKKYVVKFDQKKDKIGTGGTNLELFLNKIIKNNENRLVKFKNSQIINYKYKNIFLFLAFIFFILLIHNVKNYLY